MRNLVVLLGLLALPVIAAEEVEQQAVAETQQTVGQPTEWMSSTEFDEYRIVQNDNLKFPDSIEGRSHNGELQYRAVFKDFLPGMNYYYSHWGLTNDWYVKEQKKHADQGYKLHSHSAFKNGSGADIHQATWVMTGEVPVLGWESLIIPLLIWLAIPAYFSLQVYTLKRYAGVSRLWVIVPAVGFIVAIVWTVLGFTLMQNLPALPLLSFAPLALVWLLVVMVARSLFLKRDNSAAASTNPVH